MIDDHDVREMLHRRADAVPATPVEPRRPSGGPVAGSS